MAFQWLIDPFTGWCIHGQSALDSKGISNALIASMDREDDISEAADLSFFGPRGVAARPFSLLEALRGLPASPRVRNGTPVETGLPFSTRGLTCGPTRFILILGRSYEHRILQ